MKIGIIGLGMVGGAVKHGLTRIGQEIHGFDIKDANTSIQDILNTELCFICVPTPQTTDGSCDTSIVEKVVHELADASYKGLVVIKSTVTPGTTDRLSKKLPQLRIAFCPEFLREKAAYTDFVENHDLCVIGAYSESDAQLIADAHGSLPQHIAKLTPHEAEFTKYFSNVYNALLITFANEFFDVCKAVGVDYSHIKNAMVHRRTINDSYLDCNDRFRGFGGNCLPKDTSAFAHFVSQLNLDLKLFKDIVEENKKFRTTVL